MPICHLHLCSYFIFKSVLAECTYIPDICEDPELRERIMELRTEQESKRQQEAARRRVKRTQSNNTRTQSVRRTSIRDKTLTSKKDAVEEARLRLQAQEVDVYELIKKNMSSSSLCKIDNSVCSVESTGIFVGVQLYLTTNLIISKY